MNVAVRRAATEADTGALKKRAAQLRGKIIDMSHAAQAAHLASSLSCADVLTAAYWHVLNVNPERPDDPLRDRFILSKGHAAAALYGGLNAVLQLLSLRGETAEIANVMNSSLLAAIVAAIAVAMMQVTARDLLAAPEQAPAVAAPSDAADRKLIDALMRLMADERIYRHDNVTIGTLATKLSIPEYRLRRLINQRLGYRNFNVFLNEHRIAEAKAALADPAQAEVPVITIAMDAGFQSLGPFNRAFKATTGVTPSEYRKLKASVA